MYGVWRNVRSSGEMIREIKDLNMSFKRKKFASING